MCLHIWYGCSEAHDLGAEVVARKQEIEEKRRVGAYLFDTYFHHYYM